MIRPAAAIIALFCAPLAAAAEDLHKTYAAVQGISTKTLLQTTKSWDGRTLPAYGEGPAEISIVKYEFEPGAVIPMHMHPVINAGILLKGELTITTKTGETVTVREGDTVVELFKIWHSGANTGSVKTELIMFYAGHPGVPLAIRE
jgi:quercetin dioxygenase-like cupin family protein